MTAAEENIMDELYFVTDLATLEKTLSSEVEDLLPVLFTLYEKGWVTLMKDEERLTGCTREEFISHADSAVFLATKEGLFAHNSR